MAKETKLTPLEKTTLQANILRRMKRDPEFRKKVMAVSEKKKKEKELKKERLLQDVIDYENDRKFLTKFHKENYEKGVKQIEEWKKSPSTYEEIMKQQKERER